MFSRVIQPPQGSFFLLGPRGTGKSTWIFEGALGEVGVSPHAGGVRSATGNPSGKWLFYPDRFAQIRFA